MAKKNKTEFEKSFTEDVLLWKDRKRWLGMPLSFTRYSVDNDRLYVKKGLFTTTTDEILLYRILDIKSSRSFGQKLCGVGTITLYSADSSDSTLELKNIKQSDKVRKFLSRIIEQRRADRGITGREMYGVGGSAASQRPDFDGDGVPDAPPLFVDTDGDGVPDSMD